MAGSNSIVSSCVPERKSRLGNCFVVLLCLSRVSVLSYCRPSLCNTYHPHVLLAQYYKIVKDAQATTTETSPPSQHASVNSDLFPPPDVPLENAHSSGFGKAFTRDDLASLPPEKDEDEMCDRNPFYGQTMANGSDDHTVNRLGGQGLVASGNNEGDFTATERVHEVAVLEQPGVVLETARFTSVVSPPADQLMMAQQVSSIHFESIQLSGHGCK